MQAATEATAQVALDFEPETVKCAGCGGEVVKDDATWIRIGSRMFPHCDDCADDSCDWCGEPCEERFCSAGCRRAAESDRA